MCILSFCASFHKSLLYLLVFLNWSFTSTYCPNLLAVYVLVELKVQWRPIIDSIGYFLLLLLLVFCWMRTELHFIFFFNFCSFVAGNDENSNTVIAGENARNWNFGGAYFDISYFRKQMNTSTKKAESSSKKAIRLTRVFRTWPIWKCGRTDGRPLSLERFNWIVLTFFSTKKLKLEN